MKTELNTVENILPNIKAKDVFGKTIEFRKLKSEYVLLVFLRYAGCPWCNLAIHRLRLEYKELTANKCEVIAFVQSDTESILKNIYERHDPKPPFSIIPDSEMVFYKMYDVKPSVAGFVRGLIKFPEWLKAHNELGFKQTEVDGKFFMVPGWFLYSNRTNKIVKQQRGISLHSHEAFLDIYESLYFKD